jgi:hypothetical protein
MTRFVVSVHILRDEIYAYVESGGRLIDEASFHPDEGHHFVEWMAQLAARLADEAKDAWLRAEKQGVKHESNTS